MRKSKNILLVLCFLVFLTSVGTAFAEVIINEVMANPLDEDTGEFIELYNNGLVGVNINGWGIYDPDDLNDIIGDFLGANDFGLAGTIIPAGGYALIVDSEYAGEYNAYLAAKADPTKVIVVTNSQDTTLGNNGLTNGGDTITLDNKAGTTTTYTWTSDAGDGKSWSKILPNNDNSAGNWKIGNSGGTPGKNNNAAPVVDPISAQEAVENVDFSYLVKASDSDTEQKNLFISVADSNLAWLTVDGTNKLLLIGKPNQANIGVQEIKVVVSDGIDKSAPVLFNLTVKPALEISSIKVKGQIWDGNSQINVSPGEKVTIEYNFKNNHNTKNFGHVEASYETNPLFASETLVCQGVDCDEGYWSLNSGDTGKAVFNLEIPYTGIGSNQFELSLKTEYDDHWWLFGDDFKDEKKIEFNIIKEDSAVHLEDATLFDSNLTCTRATELNLVLINYGENPVTPELLVYDKKPIISSFNKVTGKFTQFEGQPTVKIAETLDEIDPNTGNVPQQVSLNLSALNSGEHTLYLYLVNPYFDGNQKFIGDSAELKVKVGACLNKTEIEKKLVIAKNTATPTEINLIDKDADGNYKYLIEDKDYDNSLRFGISDQTNDPLIFCSFNPDLQTLHCDAPKPSQDGNSELTLQIKENSIMDSVVEEKVKVTVTPGMSLSSLKINSATVNENGDTAPFKPDQEIKVDYTLTNYLDHPITGIQSKFSASGINVVGKEIVNLKAGESKPLSLLVKLPYNLNAEKKSATLSVEGNDYDNPNIIQKEGFNFNLVIEEEPADLVISDLTADDNGIITCKDSINLNVELTNKGSNDEKNVIVSLKGNKLDKSLTLPVWNKNLKNTVPINVQKINLTTGTNTITAKISYRNGMEEDSKTVTVQKNNCLKTFVPEKTNLITADGKAVNFEVNLSENGFDSGIQWSVDGIIKSSGKKFSFVETKAGDYSVKASINGDEEHLWKVTVTDKPIYSEFETNIPADVTQEKLKSFDNLMVKNSYGQIVFNGPVDLTNIFDLSEVIFIGDGKIAIDTVKAPELNQPATLTLNKNFLNHQIQVSDSFKTGDFKECSETVCKALSNTNGLFVFTVTGFSTYQVVEEQPADISISEILVENAERGQNATVQVTVKNIGTSDSLTGLKTELYGLNSKYKAEIVGSLPTTLEAGKEAKLELKLTVPEDEDGGKHDIGLFRVISNEKSKSAEIYLNPKSYLSLENLKINGKNEGDLTLEEINKIAVKVRNDYLEDMENVVVNVKILDVDDDDLEEESEEFDINSGDAESTTLEFDLSDEIVDEEEYELEITITGETDSGSEQELTFTQTVKVAREKHQVIVKNAALSNNILGCSISQTELDLVVENVGQSNEKDLTVKLENSELGIDSAKEGIDLDKYSKDDNSESLAFSLDLEGAPAGTYPLDVKVYRGTHLEDSQTLNLVIEECLEEKEAEQVQQQLAQESAQKLEQDLKAKQNQTAPEIKSSFRDTKNYVLLLGVMMILAVIAICLGIAVMVKRKK